MEKEIIEGIKLLATYLGFRYYGFVQDDNRKDRPKLGWYRIKDISGKHPLSSHPLIKSGYVKLEDNIYGKFIGRNHGNLLFWNSYDWLFEVVEKLEKEDLQDKKQKAIMVDVDTSWVEVYILMYDDDYKIISTKREDLPKKQQLFWALIETVKYLENGQSNNS